MDQVLESLPEIIFQLDQNECSLSDFFKVMTLLSYDKDLLSAFTCYYLSMIFEFLEATMDKPKQILKPNIIRRALTKYQTHQIIRTFNFSKNEWVIIWWCYVLLNQDGFVWKKSFEPLVLPQLFTELRIEYV